ncbi:MAG: hypothetical protein KDK38_12775, partial [Leptospiraceae bacterium]|nr:hypothetical protein [Leptospiraceae bacterium]
MSKKWIISVLTLLSVGQLSADPLFLSLPIDAVNQSQANSGVASVRGPSAIRYNPAGLGFANGHEARTTYQLLGDFLSANSVQATYSFAPYFSVGFFFSALYLNEGFTQVENFQETSNSLGMFSADVGVSAGYQVLKNLAFGGNLRYFRLQLGPQVAQSIGVDLGTQYKFN